MSELLESIDLTQVVVSFLALFFTWLGVKVKNWLEVKKASEETAQMFFELLHVSEKAVAYVAQTYVDTWLKERGFMDDDQKALAKKAAIDFMQRNLPQKTILALEHQFLGKRGKEDREVDFVRLLGDHIEVAIKNRSPNQKPISKGN